MLKEGANYTMVGKLRLVVAYAKSSLGKASSGSTVQRWWRQLLTHSKRKRGEAAYAVSRMAWEQARNEVVLGPHLRVLIHNVRGLRGLKLEHLLRQGQGSSTGRRPDWVGPAALQCQSDESLGAWSHSAVSGQAGYHEME